VVCGVRRRKRKTGTRGDEMTVSRTSGSQQLTSTVFMDVQIL
jgi:hypothetical protein